MFVCQRLYTRIGRLVSIDQLTFDSAGDCIIATRAEAVMTTRSLSRHESFQLDSPALLRPQSPTVAGPLQRIAEALNKCQAVTKESPLTVIGLSTKRSPKISEVIQQTKVLCEVGAKKPYRTPTSY